MNTNTFMNMNANKNILYTNMYTVQVQIINMYMINTGTSEHAHKQELEYEHICEQVQHEHMLYCT